MLNFYKILPVLVLASALSPVAANARSNAFPDPNAATEYLVGATASQGPAFSQGRGAQVSAPAGQVLTDKAPADAAPNQEAAEASFNG